MEDDAFITSSVASYKTPPRRGRRAGGRVCVSGWNLPRHTQSCAGATALELGRESSNTRKVRASTGQDAMSLCQQGRSSRPGGVGNICSRIPPPQAGLVDTQHTTHAWDPTRPTASFWFSRFLKASRIFVDFPPEPKRHTFAPSQCPSINFDLSLRSRASRRRCPRSSPATSPATAGQFPALFKNT